MNNLEAIKNGIDMILEKRKESCKRLRQDLEKINSLENILSRVIGQVSNLDYENKEYYIKSLAEIKAKIMAIKNSSASLSARFNRTTVNLGVAGATQAGKSTLLQAISGLSEDELPTAMDGDPTTAARSILINNPTNVAIAKFRTKDEFLALINGFLENTGKTVYDVEEFRNLNIESLKNTDDAVLLDNLNKLDEVQKIFVCHNFENYYGKEKSIEFNEINNYVSYCKGKELSNCYWPIVKIVEIKCNFTALNQGDIKLSLVDLPGMGEREEVDKQMVKGLEEEVDNVLLLFKTTAVQPQRDLKTFNAIKDAQRDIRDKTKFLSFFINIAQIENQTIQDGQIKSVEDRIAKNFSRIGGDFATYKTDAYKDKSKVANDLVDVLNRLSGNLLEMDADLLVAWENSIDYESIKKSVNEFVNQIKNELPYSEEDDIKLRRHTNEIVDHLTSFEDLREEFRPLENKKIKEEIIEVVTNINSEIINNPLNDDDWDLHTKSYYRENHVLPTKECTRLNTYVRAQYEKIAIWADKYYNELKTRIVTKFNELLGCPSFIEGEGDVAIENALRKFGNADCELPYFINAFKSLNSEKLSFHQIVYKYILQEKVDRILDPQINKGGMAKFSGNNTPGVSDEEVLATFKEELINLVREAGYHYKSIICRECPDAIAAFLYGKIEYFDDCLNRTDLSRLKDDNFYMFCKQYRLELWPDEFGQNSQSSIVKSILTDLKEITEKI